MSLRRPRRIRRARPRRQGPAQATSSHESYSEIKDEEKEDPDHVHEVPVQGHRGWTDMVARIELSARRSVKDQGEKDQAAQHVRPVKAGHGEERAGEAVGGEGQAALEGGDELVQLAE